MFSQYKIPTFGQPSVNPFTNLSTESKPMEWEYTSKQVEDIPSKNIQHAEDSFIDFVYKCALHNPKSVNWNYVSSLKLTVDEYKLLSPFLIWSIVSKTIDLKTALHFTDKIKWESFIDANNIDINILVNNVMQLKN